MTALLTIFVSFHGSEKSCLSASEKNHFDIKWSLYNVQFAKKTRKYPYSPHRREWNFLGGGGFCKTQKFKTICEALLELPEGWGSGVLEKLPSVGEEWIFSGVTHCLLIWITNLRGML